MKTDMYQLAIPQLTRGLHNLRAILGKGQEFAERRKLDPASIASMRLYPDMLPLSKQVQIASDTAKGAAARLAVIEIPKHEDTESNLLELQARIDKALRVVQSVTAAQLAGAEDREILIQTSAQTLRFTGLSYLLSFALPNFHFHSTMTYALLRELGVELGKKDYLGAIQ